MILYEQFLQKNLIELLYYDPLADLFSVTAYLFLALYGSTTLQSGSFLKKYRELFLQVELVNNQSIPSMHAKEKLPFVLINTLLIYIPLLALTRPQTE